MSKSAIYLSFWPFLWFFENVTFFDLFFTFSVFITFDDFHFLRFVTFCVFLIL